MSLEFPNPAIRLYLQNGKSNNIHMILVFITQGDSEEKARV
jgi:hypothetical protein